MFKFNFSSHTSSPDKSCTTDTEEEKSVDGKAEELALDWRKRQNDLPSMEVKCGGVTITLLKRTKALGALRSENSNNESVCPTLDAEMNNSDRIPSEYEGGMKIWSCCDDLADYVGHLDKAALTNKSILDLGCGSGLVGLVALRMGASHITFQEYNHEVLKHWTCPNVSLNVSNECGTEVNSGLTCSFWTGDWSAFTMNCTDKFDYILTSETIYFPKNYYKLREVFYNNTKPDSTILVAAKSVYFGVGGSVQLFLSELNKEKDIFQHREVFRTDCGVQRVIIEIKRKDAANVT